MALNSTGMGQDPVEAPSNSNISREDLLNIINEYQPKSWYRIFARYTLGLVFESFRYSMPIWNLKQLVEPQTSWHDWLFGNIEQQPILKDSFEKNDIQNALLTTSMFDLKYSARQSKLDNPEIVNIEKHNLDTDEAIEKILNHFR